MDDRLGIKRVLRTHLGPRVEKFLPALLAEEILKALKLSRWRISKELPDPPRSTPGE